MKKIFILSISLFLVAAYVLPVFALTGTEIDTKVREILPIGSVNSGDSGVGQRSALPTGNFREVIIPRAINIVLALGGTVSFIVFVYAGVMLIIAQGNEEEITKFKNILLWSVVGLIFITTAYGLVRGIMQLSFR